MFESFRFLLTMVKPLLGLLWAFTLAQEVEVRAGPGGFGIEIHWS